MTAMTGDRRASEGTTLVVTTQTIRVQGMTCANCVRHVTTALLAVPGVVRADVDLARAEATLEVETPIADATLAPVLDEAGYRLG